MHSVGTLKVIRLDNQIIQKSFGEVKSVDVNGIAQISVTYDREKYIFRKSITLDKFISNFVVCVKDINATFESKNNPGYI